MCHALGLGSGCSNKVPESGGSSVIEVYLSQSWGLQVWDQGASRVEFWWEPSSGLQTASVSLCPHMVESTDDAKCLVSLMKTVMLCMRNPLLTSLTLMISLISQLLIWSHGGRTHTHSTCNMVTRRHWGIVFIADSLEYISFLIFIWGSKVMTDR